MSTTTTVKKSSRKDWHKADVIAALHKRGTSLRQLGLSHGFNSRSLTKVLRKHWHGGELIVAGALGLSPTQIWPSRYDARTPLGARRLARINDSSASAARNVRVLDKGRCHAQRAAA